MTHNVVLICLDSVRKDYFDEYATTLRDICCTSFEQCRAASSCSVPSHASMMTGELPHEHGINSFDADYSKLDPVDTFVSDLPEHTALGVSANIYAGSIFGFDGLFDDFTDVSGSRRFPDGLDAEEYTLTTDADGVRFYTRFLKRALAHDHPLKTLANAGFTYADIKLFSRLPLPKPLDDGAKGVFRESKKLIKRSSEPFFLFVNVMDAHGPHQNVWGYDQSLHDVPNVWNSITELDRWAVNREGTEGYEEEIENYRQLYAAAIDYVDRKTSEFIGDVQQMTDLETSCVVTADHGENLAHDQDEKLLGHMSSVSESLLHVPLIVVNSPDGYDEHETEYISHLSLGEFVAGLADHRSVEVFTERPAAERIGTPPDGIEVEDAETAWWSRGLRCVYEGECKVVWDSLGEVIGYEIDHARPCWQRPIEDDVEVPPWSGELFDEDIVNCRAAVDSAGSIKEDIDAFTQKRLEELGYL